MSLELTKENNQATISRQLPISITLSRETRFLFAVNWIALSLKPPAIRTFYKSGVYANSFHQWTFWIPNLFARVVNDLFHGTIRGFPPVQRVLQPDTHAFDVIINMNVDKRQNGAIWRQTPSIFLMSKKTRLAKYNEWHSTQRGSRNNSPHNYIGMALA